jgi:hypothetical protein
MASSTARELFPDGRARLMKAIQLPQEILPEQGIARATRADMTPGGDALSPRRDDRSVALGGGSNDAAARAPVEIHPREFTRDILSSDARHGDCSG